MLPPAGPLQHLQELRQLLQRALLLPQQASRTLLLLHPQLQASLAALTTLWLGP